jgi:hypothetical protein
VLAGRAAGTAAGISSAAAAAAGTSSVSGDPRSGAGAALTGDTGAGSDGVVVGTDSSVGVGSDCQNTIAGSLLGQTVSLPVLVIPEVVITTVRCSGVGCGAGCGAGCGNGWGSALGGTESDGGGGGSVSVGDVSTTGGVVTSGGDVGASAGSATCCPFTIVVLSPVVRCCCSVEEGCSTAQASLELRRKAKRHKTSAAIRATGLQPCRWA